MSLIQLYLSTSRGIVFPRKQWVRSKSESPSRCSKWAPSLGGFYTPFLRKRQTSCWMESGPSYNLSHRNLEQRNEHPPFILIPSSELLRLYENQTTAQKVKETTDRINSKKPRGCGVVHKPINIHPNLFVNQVCVFITEDTWSPTSYWIVMRWCQFSHARGWS